METAEKYISLGWRMMDVRRHAAAADLFSRALSIAPNHAGALGALAIATSGMGQHGRSVKIAREGVAASPDTAWNHYVLGWALSAAGQHRKAIVNLDRAVALSPLCADFWCERANCRYSVGDYFAAQKDAEEALRLAPESADAMNAMGLSLYYGGLPRRGYELLLRCRQAHPADARTHANIGWCASASGNYDESYRSFRRALELRPGEQRWVAPMIKSARLRLSWFKSARDLSRHVVTMAVVVIVGLIGVPTVADAASQTTGHAPDSAMLAWCFFAAVVAAVLALTVVRPMLGTFLGCADPELRRITLPEARAAGGAAGLLLVVQATLLLVSLVTMIAGIAWLSAVLPFALLAVYATQQPGSRRRAIEVGVGVACAAWVLYGLIHDSTRLWAIVGVILLGLLASRFDRLRRQLVPRAGLPSLH